MPLGAFILLFKYVREEGLTKQYFLILYQGLKANRFYWEFINTLRKVLILSVFVLNNTLKVVLSSIVLIVTARIQMILEPYKDERNNDIELLAVSSGIVTILANLIYTESDKVDTLNLVTLLIIITINMVFLLNWALLFTQQFEEKSKVSLYVS